ncbi:MAG: acetyl-CoA C-acyltransferase [Candidatus Obscuribacterales bacterium]|nr:acetyl-CoA C-acyltransferase [Candidatus Obscuribacterales bacterium]
MKEVVIVDAVRTPFGRYGGALKDIRPDDLAAIVIAELMKRNPGVPAGDIEDVIFGCANQAGEDNRNVARMALLLAGLPDTVGGCTVNRLCASSMEAVARAAMGIQTGMGDIYIAGGTESMTRAPLVMAKAESAFSRDVKVFDTTLGWRFTNDKLAKMHHPYSMGETAENVAQKYNVTRERQDDFALASQHKYGAARNENKFADEIVPVIVPLKKGETKTIDTDEHPRPETTMADLKKLRAAFRDGGSVTAGNSSGINDGAAALLIMSADRAAALGLKPLARFVGSAAAGVDPACMGIGPVPATRKVLQRANLKVEDIDLFELNEAFAAQVLASVDELGINLEKVNVNGGAIAIGHPLGASGARIIGTLLREMNRRKARYGLATMCIGVGQGMACLFELV